MYASPEFLTGLDEIVSGIDATIKASLQESRDSYFSWLIWSAIIVAMGVVLEGPEVISEFCAVFGRKKRRRTPKWIVAVGLLGWLLIVIGVAGEGITEALVSLMDGSIQTFNDILLADEKRRVEYIRSTAESARATAKAFEARISDANRAAAEANREAARERLALVKLQAEVAWRSLTDLQQKDFSDSLKRFAGQLIECAFIGGDPEAFSFASNIASALRMGNWRVIPPNPSMVAMKETSPSTTESPIVKMDTGVELVSTPDSGSASAAKAVATELQRRGFDAEYKPTSERSNDQRVWILVLHRPPGAQGEAKVRRK